MKDLSYYTFWRELLDVPASSTMGEPPQVQSDEVYATREECGENLSSPQSSPDQPPLHAHAPVLGVHLPLLPEQSKSDVQRGAGVGGRGGGGGGGTGPGGPGAGLTAAEQFAPPPPPPWPVRAMSLRQPLSILPCATGPQKASEWL